MLREGEGIQAGREGFVISSVSVVTGGCVRRLGVLVTHAS